MKRVVLSGIGIEIPANSISNDDLVATYNAWVESENVRRRAAGEEELSGSSSDFIVHASGIRARRVLDRDGILDPARMAPRFPARADDELSVIAEFGIASARRAMDHAGVEPGEIDMVICSASHPGRTYPAIAIEIQDALGTQGAGFDMGLGCSSAAAGLHVAANLVRTGAQKRILLTVPEIVTGHVDFRDRQTHFLFGDASASMILEAVEDEDTRPGRFEILDTRTWTQFSNNLRSNFGFVTRLSQEDPSYVDMEGNYLNQVGNKVFKEVTHAGHRFIRDFLADNGLTTDDIRRFWLHQANSRMNAMILRMTLGCDVSPDRAPIILENIGNTAAAGAIIALKENHEDMAPGDLGLICAFGAGYSIGGTLLRMM